MPNSRSFALGLHVKISEFNRFKNERLFDQLLNVQPDAVINAGVAEQKDLNRAFEKAMDTSFVVALGGDAKRFGKCLAVVLYPNGPRRSEIGNMLAEVSRNRGLRPVAVLAYDQEDIGPEMFKVSLRSLNKKADDDNDNDMTPLAVQYGGGGHRNACSFMIKKEEFNKWRVE